jgi:hypothetical protein
VIAAGPEIAQLAPERRRELAELWQARALSESSVKSVFEQLVAELSATGAHPEVLALARRALSDEARHARICAELAAAYRGGPVLDVIAPAVRLPDYPVSPRLRAALHAVNLCCIGETIATAFVEACLAECAWPALRELHGRHLADEIHHARIGWAHLASLSLAERGELACHLPELVRAQVLAWEARLGELPERGVPGHGYPPRATLVAVVHGAVRDVVLPGFEYVEVDATRARAWFDTHTAGQRANVIAGSSSRVRPSSR